MSANHTPMCIWDDCGSDAIYCEGHAREYMAPNIDALKTRERELVEALRVAVKYVPESTFYGGQEALRPHPDGERVRAVLAKMTRP